MLLLVAYPGLPRLERASALRTYHALNIAGSAGLVVNGWVNGVFASVVLNIVRAATGAWHLCRIDTRNRRRAG